MYYPKNKSSDKRKPGMPICDVVCVCACVAIYSLDAYMHVYKM